MEILICVLMIILLAVQIWLAIKQIKRKAPDGKILLIIDIAVIVIWIPLSVLMFVFKHTGFKIAWFVVSALYMIFTMWYTNAMRK